MPQIAPLIILIQTAAIFYSIKQYGLMKQETVSGDELILNKISRMKIYNYISISFIVGGLLNFISQYLLNDKGDLISVLCFSELICSIGLVIELLQRLKLREYYKDFISISTISLIIPIITLRFIKTASITIWFLPFMFIVVAIVFNKRTALVSITLSALLTQIIIWIMVPQTFVRVNHTDYIVRIGLLSIAAWFAYHVNEVYILRLKENIIQMGFQKLISEISSDFVTVNQLNLDGKIYNMLKKSGEFLQVDRAYALIYDLENYTVKYNY